ncbi:MAG: tyrosine-type recombinase/integrase [Saprospiraceae bacterium]|nr:tyrosine-type recombinase/integrase [Saprospiraceae bacterium]
MIILLYSTGMRVSEITNLKLIDIDSKLMRINCEWKRKKTDLYPYHH